MLLNIHVGLSIALKNPALQLSDDEAKMLAKSALELSEYYDVGILSGKTMAWVNFAMAMGSVYGPRLLLIATTPKNKPTLVNGTGRFKTQTEGSNANIPN